MHRHMTTEKQPGTTNPVTSGANPQRPDQHWLKSHHHTAGRQALFALAAQFSTLIASVCMAHVGPLPNQIPEPQLKPGDIVYADSGDAIHGGFIIKVDPLSGQKLVLSSGGYLQEPFDPVIDATGQIVVSDLGRLIRINP